MKNNSFETLIGLLVVITAIFFGFFSFKLSNTKQALSNGYKIFAEFDNIDGINVGSDIKISGVKTGNVVDIKLNTNNYKGLVTIKIQDGISVPTDSIFKISTSGLIGSKFINIKIGSENINFKDSEKVEFTESTMDLEDLISRFIFNSGDKK